MGRATVVKVLELLVKVLELPTFLRFRLPLQLPFGYLPVFLEIFY
jgi:hypothetical protein